MTTLLAAWLWVWALVVTWPFLILFVGVTFWFCSEDEPRFFAFLSNILITSIVIFMFGITWDIYKWYLVAYIPVGILWSFYRFDRFAKRIVKDSNDPDFDPKDDPYFWLEKPRMEPKQIGDSPRDFEEEEKQFDKVEYQKWKLSLNRNVGRITHWILSWPVSAVCWGLRDILEAVKTFITVHARKIYEAIAARYIEDE
jgi:hypothetical protein